MDKTLRSILWILVILVLLSSFTAGWFFVAKERLYDEYVSLENLFKTTMERLNREIDSASKENVELRAKLEEVNKELRLLESRNKEWRSKYSELLKEQDDLQKELARVRKGKYFIEKKLKEMKSEAFMASLLRKNASLEVEIEKLRKSMAPKEMEIDRLRDKNVGLDTMISRLKQENDVLRQRLKDSEKVTELLSRNLLEEKNRHEEEQQVRRSLEIENRTLKTKVSELEKISKRYSNLLAKKQEMEFKISNLMRELEDKNIQIDKLKIALETERTDERKFRAEGYHGPEEVELPPIVLQRNDHVEATAGAITLQGINESNALKGRIVTVNREHNFVVIDLGRQDGIDIGAKFNVYRDNSLIGTLEVIQTRERIAACDIVDVEEGYFIEIDDLIIEQ